MTGLTTAENVQQENNSNDEEGDNTSPSTKKEPQQFISTFILYHQEHSILNGKEGSQMKWADYKKQITSLNQSEIDQIEIVAQLVQRRIQLGLTQQELADKSHLKQAAIARLERESATPRLDTLEKVAGALGLKVALVEDHTFSNEAQEIEHI